MLPRPADPGTIFEGPVVTDRHQSGSPLIAEVALTIDVRNDVLVVHGSTPLRGEVGVRGAKNLVSKAMVAAVLGETPSRLYDVPRIRDVEIVRGLLELHGVRVSDPVEVGTGLQSFARDPSGNMLEIHEAGGAARRSS